MLRIRTLKGTLATMESPRAAVPNLEWSWPLTVALEFQMMAVEMQN